MPSFSVFGTSDGRRIVRSVGESYAQELAARIHAETGEQIDVVPDEAVPAGLDTGQLWIPLEQLSKRSRAEIDGYAAATLGIDTRAAKTKKDALKLCEARYAENVTGEGAAATVPPDVAAFFAQWDDTAPDELISKIEGWVDADTPPTSDEAQAIADHEAASLNRTEVLDAVAAYIDTLP